MVYIATAVHGSTMVRELDLDGYRDTILEATTGHALELLATILDGMTDP